MIVRQRSERKQADDVGGRYGVGHMEEEEGEPQTRRGEHADKPHALEEDMASTIWRRRQHCCNVERPCPLMIGRVRVVKARCRVIDDTSRRWEAQSNEGPRSDHRRRR